MDLQAKIDEFKAKTKEIRAANPAIEEIHWELKDIPYKEFKAFNDHLRSIDINASPNRYRISESHTGDILFFSPYYAHEFDGCQVTFWSLPVKIKHTIEVEELT